ncbi:mycothiol system anti-sigma-R factor [Cellulomonas dongxiuzhuiae]|uniref:Mycothiol system anti-sigma-R factor n=1 Tax=Cellulomonas dongxiuzhuiae TaxID=2819979 RepID=A0ABX8GPK2_9CELL|nr:mycothiol system anti-sigma-R factor [Cellulomonas dongxiuzhuiae]MBO3087791.1 mycothiol system anti-sigma-R factor [Cellulomonas dongxiuzhuiae]MBO3095828.1 mycothiol system anti-sigma-R factor [Cellulomonas dongxiuzhuiae]QWC17134.1 mycothiol system anti-sigma-R factor [Cellulomonas dongxiuzhuiae]
MSAPEDAGSGPSTGPGPVDGTACGCDEAVERLWEYVDSELGDLDQKRVQAHLDECAPCLEEEHVEVVLKQLVRRCCQEEAPAALRLRIREQLTVLRQRAGAEPEA